MRFYERKTKPLEKLVKNLKKSLEEPDRCKACQMELVATRDSEGDIRIPKNYCDYKCKEVFEKYKFFLREGRIMADKAYIRAYYPHKDDVPRIDLSV